MRISVIFILSFVTILLQVSCTDKEDQPIGSPEQVLPGLWRIDTVELIDYITGITYQGNTFFNDTVLHHVGKIQISSFSLDSLEAIDLGEHRVECTLDIDGEEMNVAITALFKTGTEWKATIFYNGPDGFQLIDTPIEEFYSTTHIFHNFYTLEIADNDHIRLWTTNEAKNHVMSLARD